MPEQPDTTNEQVNVEVTMTTEELERLQNAEYEIHLEEHEGATWHAIFSHDHYGLIGFSVATCPADLDVDMVIGYSQWETEPHHELDHDVYQMRDGWR